MNSGMETVSISTKSALPNSRLSCSAMAPAYGLRWAQTDSGGRARAAGAGGGRAASSGGAGAGPRRGTAGEGAPGAARRVWAGRRPPRCSSARSRPARHTRQFPLLPRRLPGAGGTGHRKGDGGGWSRLWPWSGPGPAQSRPGLSGSAPPRPAD